MCISYIRTADYTISNNIFNQTAMTRVELQKKFPLEGELTMENIQDANPKDICDCAGYRTAWEALTRAGIPFSNLCWGVWDGSFEISDRETIWMTTKENIDFMKETNPQKVTFIIGFNEN